MCGLQSVAESIGIAPLEAAFSTLALASFDEVF
jgi:hypothetical protein